MPRLDIPARLRRLLVAPAGLAGLLLAGCAAVPPEPTVAAADPEVGQTVEDPGQEVISGCAALDELGCIESADCTLRQKGDKSYACTPAADDCERGFLQRAGRQDDCPEGCNFSPPQCYCAPDVLCVCGGGPPATCQAAS